jgi:RNA polymerase sigma-70 factor (sigma-E family)
MRQRREDEFRAYVTARRPAVLRTATLLTAGDSHLAEDLVQQALIRLYVAWPRVRSSSGPDAYLHRVLVNALIDTTRKPSWRREQYRSELPEPPAEPALGLEDREAVRRALAQLPAGMRAAVVLRHWLELDVAETAAALGCTQGNVKSQTARGLDRLRELLEADDATTTRGQT